MRAAFMYGRGRTDRDGHGPGDRPADGRAGASGGRLRLPAYAQAIGVVRPGGVISRVGVPQYSDAPVGFGSLFGPNIALTGGPAPARAYIEELMPAVLDGTVRPGTVFDRAIGLDGVPEGYRAMDRREALKVLIRP